MEKKMSHINEEQNIKDTKQNQVFETRKTDYKYFFEIENVSKIFKNGAGVRDVTFHANKGNIIGFVGDNGAGKTTTIKLILREYKKDSGDVFLEGNSHKHREVLQKIAFFPDQNNYPKGYKIKEFAYYSADLKHIAKSEVDKYFDDFIDALSLSNFKNASFDELSAGMQKRALLLSVLVTDPEIIILDEPTANVDVKSRLEFLEVLKILAEKYKKTILITSHNIDELSTLINRVIIIDKGIVLYKNNFDGQKEDLRSVYVKALGKKDPTINYKKIDQIFVEREKNHESSKKI